MCVPAASQMLQYSMYTHPALKSLLIRYYAPRCDLELMRTGLQHIGRLYHHFTPGQTIIMEELAVKSQEQFLGVVGELVMANHVIGLELLGELVYDLFASDEFKKEMESGQALCDEQALGLEGEMSVLSIEEPDNKGHRTRERSSSVSSSSSSGLSFEEDQWESQSQRNIEGQFKSVCPAQATTEASSDSSSKKTSPTTHDSAMAAQVDTSTSLPHAVKASLNNPPTQMASTESLTPSQASPSPPCLPELQPLYPPLHTHYLYALHNGCAMEAEESSVRMM